jgi:hypothetical protein
MTVTLAFALLLLAFVLAVLALFMQPRQMQLFIASFATYLLSLIIGGWPG